MLVRSLDTGRRPSGLLLVPGPSGTQPRRGLSTSSYLRRIIRDYAAQDARNRHLGMAGEQAVVESERNALIKCGRSDLAEMVRHVAKLEGDGAGYDIKSYTPEGEEKFIDVKTTQGDRSTAFYLSSNEVRFAADHADSCYLYRAFEFDQTTSSGKVFVYSRELNRVSQFCPSNSRRCRHLIKVIDPKASPSLHDVSLRKVVHCL